MQEQKHFKFIVIESFVEWKSTEYIFNKSYNNFCIN
jgi:hypothetical protein